MRNTSLATRLVAWYGTNVPHHRGKSRLIETYIRKLRRRQRPGVWVDVIRHGTSFTLDVSDYVDQWIYLTGYYEREDYLLVIDWLRSRRLETVVFDIGAHIGFYSLGCAGALGERGVVHSFEPNPKTFERLSRHVTVNSRRNVVLNHVALGHLVARRTAFAVTKFNTGGTSLVPGAHGSLDELEPYETQVITLDAYCERQQTSPDFIKIDCQGYEPHIIRGGREVLRRSRPRMLMECDPALLSMAGWTVGDTLELLKDLGYELFYLWRGRLLPLPSRWPVPHALNLHCIPAGNGGTRKPPGTPR